MNSTSISK